MSVKYVPVQWNPNKWVYDAILLAAVVLYIGIFLGVGNDASDATRDPNGQVQRMRAFGSCAFLMLTLILCIGPLARLDRRFLPLLYNRRHFGVLTAVVAATHATYVMSWYAIGGVVPPLEALLTSNTSFGQLLGFPIEPFGIFALIILAILAATSHDFWLAFLSAPVWKALHLSIYLAYIAVVAHVALGYLQDAKNPTFGLIFMGGALAVAALHLVAWRRDRAAVLEGDWVRAGRVADIPNERAIIVHLPSGERAAVFRDGDELSAVSNACAHQGGPLGEGRIIDGCITCPWHGFQYRREDGCSPEPFTEKIPTYRIKLDGEWVMIDPTPNPPGTPVAAIKIEVA